MSAIINKFRSARNAYVLAGKTMIFTDNRFSCWFNSNIETRETILLAEGTTVFRLSDVCLTIVFLPI